MIISRENKRHVVRKPGLYNEFGNFVMDFDVIIGSINYKDAFENIGQGIRIVSDENNESYFKNMRGTLVLSGDVIAIEYTALTGCYDLEVIACDGISIVKPKNKCKRKGSR